MCLCIWLSLYIYIYICVFIALYQKLCATGTHCSSFLVSMNVTNCTAYCHRGTICILSATDVWCPIMHLAHLLGYWPSRVHPSEGEQPHRWVEGGVLLVCICRYVWRDHAYKYISLLLSTVKRETPLYCHKSFL